MLGADDPKTDVLTGMDAVKSALLANPPGQRSIAYLARCLGLSRGALLPWDKVPEEYLEKIMTITGLPARVLRPDLAEIFARDEMV